MAYARVPTGSPLLDALELQGNPKLQKAMAWLSVPKPRPTRRADMAVAIRSYLEGSSLRQIWDDLNEVQQLAVREVLYVHQDGFNSRQFEAKYGILPVDDSGYGQKLTLPFRLFLYREDKTGKTGLTVPEDLASSLLEFVPPPPEVKLASVEELPEEVDCRTFRNLFGSGKPETRQAELVRRDMDRRAVRELATVLRLINLGRVAVSQKTRRASGVAVSRIAAELEEGDFFDLTEEVSSDKKLYGNKPVGPIRAHAWPWLVQAGKLAEPRGNSLALTKTGQAALGKPPAETLRRLWTQWIKNSLVDEFSRIDFIKGQNRGKGKNVMTSPSKRRPVIAEAMAECPVGRWVLFDDFSLFMRAADHNFELTHDPWKLYIGDPQYGSLGYQGFDDWHIFQERYLLCFLFEYAATLGLIDVAYTHPEGARPDYFDSIEAEYLVYLSRYDGLQYFRLNPLGAYCLGLTQEYQPAKYEPGNAPGQASLSVFPDLRLCVNSSLTPEERLILETFADSETENVWRLSRDKIVSAAEHGDDVDHLRSFLEDRDEQPLPELVEGFLRNVERGARALEIRGTALIIECTDEDVAAKLASDKRTSKLCMPAGKRHVVVRTEAEKAFRKAAHGLGYGIRSA